MDYQRVLLYDGSNRARFYNGRMVRAVNLGTWAKVRFGILFQVETAITVINPNFVICFTHGSDNVIGDASADNAVGLTSSDSFIYSAPDDFGSLEILPFVRVNTTTTLGAAATTDMRGILASSGLWSAFVVELTYGSPNFTIKWFGRSANTGYSLSDAAFSSIMQSSSDLAATDHSLSAGASLAVDEGANGVLDHVEISWLHYYRIHVGSAYVARF